ncbi:MAG TPA: hypothetical protein VHN82_02545 [Methanoregula sp.]|nr:hypothetical protein [Methanoregula sp.]
MEISRNTAPVDRITTLEIRIRNLDALIRGLIEEVLDLKASAKTRSRPGSERDHQGLRQSPIAPEPGQPEPVSPSPPAPEAHTVIRPSAKSQPEDPVKPDMVRIMQPDGTMKMEPRSGDHTIDSSQGQGNIMKSNALRGRLAPRTPRN